jgi:hypothetical protein
MMFEHLFQQPAILTRHREGPLARSVLALTHFDIRLPVICCVLASISIPFVDGLDMYLWIQPTFTLKSIWR